jgi:hypothetical protein
VGRELPSMSRFMWCLNIFRERRPSPMIHVPQSYVQIPVGHNILISFWHDPSSLCFFAFGGFVVSLSASSGPLLGLVDATRPFLRRHSICFQCPRRVEPNNHTIQATMTAALDYVANSPRNSPSFPNSSSKNRRTRLQAHLSALCKKSILRLRIVQDRSGSPNLTILLSYDRPSAQSGSVA